LDAVDGSLLTANVGIYDKKEFLLAVREVIKARHPTGDLMKDDKLEKVILAVTMQVDSVSPVLFAPLLCCILKHVGTMKSFKKNRQAKMLATLELFKAFVQTAYAAAQKPIPDVFRAFTASYLDSLLAILIKDDGELVNADKLTSLMKYQVTKDQAIKTQLPKDQAPPKP